MKLVINVDNYKIEACKRRKEEGQNAWYHDMVLNGKPLEKEIVKELESIKTRLNLRANEHLDGDYYVRIKDINGVIDEELAKLKGENNG